MNARREELGKAGTNKPATNFPGERALAAENPAVRILAVSVMPSPERHIREIIMLATDDPNSSVRRAAVEKLGNISDSSACLALASLLGQAKTPDEFQGIIDALVVQTTNKKLVSNALAEAISSVAGDPERVFSVFRALSEVDNPRAVNCSLELIGGNAPLMVKVAVIGAILLSSSKQDAAFRDPAYNIIHAGLTAINEEPNRESAFRDGSELARLLVQLDTRRSLNDLMALVSGDKASRNLDVRTYAVRQLGALWTLGGLGRSPTLKPRDRISIGDFLESVAISDRAPRVQEEAANALKESKPDESSNISRLVRVASQTTNGRIAVQLLEELFDNFAKAADHRVDIPGFSEVDVSILAIMLRNTSGSADVRKCVPRLYRFVDDKRALIDCFWSDPSREVAEAVANVLANDDPRGTVSKMYGVIRDALKSDEADVGQRIERALYMVAAIPQCDETNRVMRLIPDVLDHVSANGQSWGDSTALLTTIARLNVRTRS